MSIMDIRSRFPVVYEVTTTTSEHVLLKLEDFSLIGIPDETMSDNGPLFNGRAFADFARFMGFRHKKITPEHPQANGMSEKFMVSLSKIIRGALAEGKNLRSELQAFLRSYRSTLHRTTGVAPSEALFASNRTIRLPHVDAPDIQTREQELLDELQRINDEHKYERAKQYTDLESKAVKHNFRIGENLIILSAIHFSFCFFCSNKKTYYLHLLVYYLQLNKRDIYIIFKKDNSKLILSFFIFKIYDFIFALESAFSLFWKIKILKQVASIFFLSSSIMSLESKLQSNYDLKMKANFLVYLNNFFI